MDFFTPTYMFAHFYDVTPQFLEEHGIRGLLIDIDNTLAPYEQPDPDDRIRAWFDDLASHGIKAALVSNNHADRVERFNSTLGLIAYHDSGKPSKKALIRAMDALGADNESSVLIGDTKYDVLGAKAVGIDCVGVRFGYAAEGELEEAGAKYIVEDMAELEKLLMG
jgi:HAD superfamily phosphatase (TIGR01668 family)